MGKPNIAARLNDAVTEISWQEKGAIALLQAQNLALGGVPFQPACEDRDPLRLAITPFATRQDIHARAENAGSHHAKNQDVYDCVVPGASACTHRWMDLGWSTAS
ncbi:MAG: hypothetical protein ACPIOQ_67430 [Promethearchaeia archaeon]